MAISELVLASSKPRFGEQSQATRTWALDVNSNPRPQKKTPPDLFQRGASSDSHFQSQMASCLVRQRAIEADHPVGSASVSIMSGSLSMPRSYSFSGLMSLEPPVSTSGAAIATEL